jgi:hypothetical protein
VVSELLTWSNNMALQLPSTNPFAANLGVSLSAMYARVGGSSITPGQTCTGERGHLRGRRGAASGQGALSARRVAFSHDAAAADPVAQAYAALKVRDEFANSKDV